MNISQLHAFIVVAQNENLSKAANMLFVSQSALSKSISKLEEELGVELFDRRGKRIVLNAQGRRFLESAIDILREIESTTQDLRAMASGSGYKLRVGCVGPMAPLCDCMTAFSAEHQDVSFEIDSSIEFLSYVEMENYDMLIYPSAPPFEKLRGYMFGTEHYLLAAPNNHPLANAESVTMNDLMDNEYVFIRRGKYDVEYTYRVCGAQALRVRRQHFASSHGMKQYLIGDGLGLGFVSEFIRGCYENDPRITLRQIDEPSFERTLWICFRDAPNALPIVQEFREYAIDYFGIDTATVYGGRSDAKL